MKEYIYSNWKVLLIAVPIVWLGIKLAASTHAYQVAVDKCVVEQFESASEMDRTQLYDYCRAKARSNQQGE